MFDNKNESMSLTQYREMMVRDLEKWHDDHNSEHRPATEEEAAPSLLQSQMPEKLQDALREIKIVDISK